MVVGFEHNMAELNGHNRCLKCLQPFDINGLTLMTQHFHARVFIIVAAIVPLKMREASPGSANVKYCANWTLALYAPAGSTTAAFRFNGTNQLDCANIVWADSVASTIGVVGAKALVMLMLVTNGT